MSEQRVDHDIARRLPFNYFAVRNTHRTDNESLSNFIEIVGISKLPLGRSLPFCIVGRECVGVCVASNRCRIEERRSRNIYFHFSLVY